MKRGKLFVKLQVLGENSFSLVETLHKKGIFVYDITFLDQKTIISIDFADFKKFFAISRNMCYNIRILKYYGKISFLKKAFSRLGLIICFCLFLALALTFDSYVSKISYVGDGEYLAPQISQLLQKEGVKERSFLKADLRYLENKLLVGLDNVSYLSLRQEGRILIVEAYCQAPKIEEIDFKKKNVVSPVDGKVVAINLLSGTALVSVGDSVKQGDVLIDGYFVKDENKIETYALGEIEIMVDFVYTYQSFASGERYKNRACMLARECLGDKNVTSQTVKEETIDGKIVYTVTLSYLVTVS